MTTLYDSGWVYATTGSILVGVDCSDVSTVSVIFAASGANGLASTFMGWTAGLQSPMPWFSSRAVSLKSPPPCTPVISGTYAVSAPAANSSTMYRIGVGQSGTNHLDDYLHDTLFLSATQWTGSWGRIVVEGH